VRRRRIWGLEEEEEEEEEGFDMTYKRYRQLPVGWRQSQDCSAE